MTVTDPAILHDELRALARGRGVRAPNLDTRVGPALRRLAELSDRPAGEVRARLTGWLHDGLAALPGDLRRVVEVALGLDPAADQPWLTHRVAWLATELDRDPRTVRRRYEDGFRLLAEMVATGTWTLAGDGPRSGDGPDLEGGRTGDVEAQLGAERGSVIPPRSRSGAWYFERVWALLRLDGPAPELIEGRRVVALEDGVTELVLPMSLPRPPDAPRHPRDLAVDIVFGGRIVRVDRTGDAFFAPVLRLPRELRRGEGHLFGCSWRVPVGQPMVRHYALNPAVRCDALDLRVRFPADSQPRVQLVDGVPLRAVEDPAVELPMIDLDGAFEATARFERLAAGFCYGLRWTD
jgi:hypothetical protein